MKLNLLKDIYSIVVPESYYPNYGINQNDIKPISSGEIKPPCTPVGSFFVLCDEAAETAEASTEDLDADDSKRGRTGKSGRNGKVEWR